jgi:DNA ligase (NAD+)
MSTASKPSEIAALVAKLEAASYAYHNGLEPVMTDEAYDAAIDLLRDAEPEHPFLTKVGAPVITGDEVALPIPLPSLNKIKDQAAIDKWTAKHGSSSYHISAKLDGVSALWFPQTKELYTRGDGMRGRNISAFVPYFKGLVISEKVVAVRGELIMRSDSTVIPAGKLARNIVAGALNRKVPDPTLFAEIRFITYELIQSVLGSARPEDANKLLRTEGFETARAAVLPSTKLNAANLSEMFSTAEGKSPYQMDGIVVAPNQPRPATYEPQVRKGEAVNPGDRVAWKTRNAAASAAAKARTIVRAVEWNVSHTGYLIPRVLFDPVVLAGATIGAATGLHGRWIHDNKVGPGAEIEVRRAGDVIPQIVAVITPSPTGPAMPLRYEWASADPATAIHIKPVGSDAVDETAIIKLGHALSELGAENVGPGIVAKLYEAGFDTLKDIYAATPADFASRLEGVKEKGAERIWTGLRVKQGTWTTLNFLVASSTMPRGVGHSKLTPLLALKPDPATWITDVASLKAAHPAGLSDKTIDAIVAAVPDYLAWIATTGFSASSVSSSALASASASASSSGPILKPEHQLVVVFTGTRDKALEAQLTAAGHVVADSVNKKTTHVVYPDGPIPTSSKITKAQELGIPVETLSAFKSHL